MVRSPGEGGSRCERGMYWLMTNLSCGGAIAEVEPRGNSRIWEAEIVCGVMLKSDMIGDIILALGENCLCMSRKFEISGLEINSGPAPGSRLITCESRNHLP